MAMTKVAEVVVGAGGSASIEFTNIPQTGKDLLILVSARRSTDTELLNFRINGNTGSNYTSRVLNGDGSAVQSYAETVTSFAFQGANPSVSTSSTFGNTAAYFSNYTGSTAKSASFDGVRENNATAAAQTISAGLFSQTDPITSITISSATVQHSTASLYIIS